MKPPVYEQLTLFPEASLDDLANHFPWLESKKVKGTTVTCGRKCSGLSENLNRVGYLVRTYLESCELPLPTLYRTWNVKDLTSSCLILKLRLSALRIAEKESLSSQTGNPGLWKTPVAADGSNREFYRNSRGEANLRGEVKLWPTPTPAAQDGKNTTLPPSQITRDTLPRAILRQMFATPCSADSQGTTGGGNGRSLRTDVQGQLNPDWVEWLQGFPIGWTEV